MNDRMNIFLRVHPWPIEINSCKWASGVSVDHSIWIHHGYDFEKKVVSEHFCTNAWTNQIIYDAFHHIWCSSFTRMYTSRNDDSFLLFHFLCAICEGSHSQQITRISSKILAKHLPLKLILCPGIRLNLCKVSLQIWVCIWITMGKVNGVIIMRKLHTECQCVIMKWTFSFYRVLIVAYVISAADPSLAITLCIDFWVQEWLHSVVV